MPRWPALIHLTGPPATGKRTVGLAIVDEAGRRGHHVVLVDNHLTARPILTVIGADGVRLLPDGVWPYVHEVRRAVHAAIEELSPPEWWIDPEGERADLERRQVLVPEGSLAVDTTRRPPAESAALILDALDARHPSTPEPGHGSGPGELRP